MIRLLHVTVAVMAGISAVCLPAVAHAEESVTYVVESADIGMVNNIQYFDGTRRILLLNVALPWRTTVSVANPRSLGFDGAEVRTDWRPASRPGKFVLTRIYFGETLICENGLDVGNAACYGSTTFNSDTDIHPATDF
jgi:hypothetical protein